MQSNKILINKRRVFIGNLPNDIEDVFLEQWLYRSLEIAGGLMDVGNPIEKVNLYPKGIFLLLI